MESTIHTQDENLSVKTTSKCFQMENVAVKEFKVAIKGNSKMAARGRKQKASLL
jgi:hypothetical protein